MLSAVTREDQFFREDLELCLTLQWEAMGWLHRKKKLVGSNLSSSSDFSGASGKSLPFHIWSASSTIWSKRYPLSVYLMGLSSGLMNVQGSQSLHTCDELREVRPWTLRLLPIRGDLSLQEWAVFIVLVIFDHFTVCLISSTHAIISYIHNNTLGSIRMKSSTSVFLGTSCVLGILCTRLKNLRKNQLMRRSENVNYLWANSCLCFYCSLWWFICLNRGSSFLSYNLSEGSWACFLRVCERHSLVFF